MEKPEEDSAGPGWEAGSLAGLKTFTRTLAHTAPSRVLQAALGEGKEVGPPSRGLAQSSPISSSPAAEARGLTLSSFADETKDRGIAKNFCFALFFNKGLGQSPNLSWGSS